MTHHPEPTTKLVLTHLELTAAAMKLTRVYALTSEYKTRLHLNDAIRQVEDAQMLLTDVLVGMQQESA